MPHSGFTRASPTLLRRSVKPLANPAYGIAAPANLRKFKLFSHFVIQSGPDCVLNSSQMDLIEIRCPAKSSNGGV